MCQGLLVPERAAHMPALSDTQPGTDGGRLAQTARSDGSVGRASRRALGSIDPRLRAPSQKCLVHNGVEDVTTPHRLGPSSREPRCGASSTTSTPATATPAPVRTWSMQRSASVHLPQHRPGRRGAVRVLARPGSAAGSRSARWRSLLKTSSPRRSTATTSTTNSLDDRTSSATRRSPALSGIHEPTSRLAIRHPSPVV